MDLLRQFVDVFLHLDKHLGQIIAQYGAWTYAILIAIVFAETGLVVTPFLPGDSLLFAAGSFAALGALDVHAVFLFLTIAAVVGDGVNYWVGSRIGARAFAMNNRLLKREYLERTSRFYEKHGGKAVVLARFVPIVRTFAPFVAGVGAMEYRRFVFYNVLGAVLWVGLFTYGGYFFGNLPVVKKNFSLVIVAIILLSVLPMVIEFVRSRRAAGGAQA
ncbi:MAG TPA: DedA family protein [Gemmatimonadales bacterium]|nr:DedA family protein [Gemmatimonadales bacterium]